MKKEKKMNFIIKMNFNIQCEIQQLDFAKEDKEDLVPKDDIYKLILAIPHCFA